MTIIPEKYDVQSEGGEEGHPKRLRIEMNGSHPDCPILFRDCFGNVVFTMGNDEAAEFIVTLEKLIL